MRKAYWLLNWTHMSLPESTVAARSTLTRKGMNLSQRFRSGWNNTLSRRGWPRRSQKSRWMAAARFIPSSVRSGTVSYTHLDVYKRQLSALSRSHLRCFAASLIADKLSAKALADAVMTIPDLEAAALQLADRSERRYGGIQKAFVAAGKSALLREEISALTTWLSL